MKKLSTVITLLTSLALGFAVYAVDKTINAPSGDLILDSNNQVIVNKEAVFDSSAIFNESGTDADFRVESDTLVNAFFMDGANGNIGVGINVPTEKIETYTTPGNGNLIRMHTVGVAEYKIGIPSGSTDLYLTNSSGAAAGTTSTRGILMDATGEVGLGLTPQAKLNLLSSATSTYTDGILFGTASNTTHGLGIWYNNNGATTAYIDSRIDSDTSKIQIRTKTDGTAVNALTVLGSGAIGIGDSPNNVGSHSTLLDIVGGSRSALQIRGTEATNVNGAIQFYEGTTLQSALQNRSTGTGKLEFTTGDGGFLFFGDITVQNGNSSLGLAYVSQDAAGNEWHFGRHNDDGNYDIVRQTGTGVTLAVSTWAGTSDGRLKKDIKDVSNAIDLIKGMKPRYFTWKDNNLKDVGFVAQELMTVYPIAVEGSPNSNVEQAPMAVSQTKIIPVLTKAIQEQQEIIEMQKQWICSQADAPRELCL